MEGQKLDSKLNLAAKLQPAAVGLASGTSIASKFKYGAGAKVNAGQLTLANQKTAAKLLVNGGTILVPKLEVESGAQSAGRLVVGAGEVVPSGGLALAAGGNAGVAGTLNVEGGAVQLGEGLGLGAQSVGAKVGIEGTVDVGAVGVGAGESVDGQLVLGQGAIVRWVNPTKFLAPKYKKTLKLR